MSKFRKKPVVIEAHQWHKNGDHPDDYSKTHDGLENGEIRQFSPEERRANGWEGDIVRYYRHPEVPGDSLCEQCGQPHHVHGWIDTLEQGHRVCPGDWIITGVNGERYPCKPDIFVATYGPADHAAPQPPAQAEHVAWLRYTKRSIVACDSDAPGAFKVYRHPPAGLMTVEAHQRIVAEAVAQAYGRAEEACSGVARRANDATLREGLTQHSLDIHEGRWRGANECASVIRTLKEAS